MPEDLLNRDFGLLPEQRTPWGSFGVSLITNIALMILLLLFTAAHLREAQKVKYNTTLIFPQEVPPPPKIFAPRVKVFAAPQPQIAKLQPPKIVRPKQQPMPEPPKAVRLDVPD